MSAGAPRRAWIFLAFALAWAWAAWGAAAVLGYPWGEPVTMILLLAGGLGVPVVALAMLFALEDRAARADFWRGLLDPRRLTVPALATSLLLPPALSLLAGVVGLAQTGDWRVSVPLDHYRVDPAALGLFLGVSLLATALPQEIGWRGYALPRLQAAHPALAAALALGLAHALWHLPLFAVAGTFHAGLGWGSPAFWSYLATLVALGVLLAWVYNAARGSVLAAVLLHFSFDVSLHLFRMPPEVEQYRAALFVAAALLLALATRGRLGSDQNRPR